MAKKNRRELLSLFLFLFLGFSMATFLDYVPNNIGWIGFVSAEYGSYTILSELVVSKPPIENSLKLIVNSTLVSIYSLGVLDVNNTRLVETVNKGLEELQVVIGRSSISSVGTTPALEGKIPVKIKPFGSVGYVYFSDGSYLFVKAIQLGIPGLMNTLMFLFVNFMIMAGALRLLIGGVFLRLFTLGVLLLVQSFPVIYYSKREFSLMFNLTTIYVLLILIFLFISVLIQVLTNYLRIRRKLRYIFEIIESTSSLLVMVTIFIIGVLAPILRQFSIKRVDLELVLGTSNILVTLAVVFSIIILQLSRKRAIYAELLIRIIYGVLGLLVLSFYITYIFVPLLKAIGYAKWVLLVPHIGMLITVAIFICTTFNRVYREVCSLTKECKPKDYLVAK